MPFKKGVSGNPKGRPKGSGQRPELMEVLRQKMPMELLAAAVDKLVKDGDSKATLYMIDRHLGRPAQAIQVSGDAERPLHMQVGIGGRQFETIEAPAPAIELPIDDEEDTDGAGDDLRADSAGAVVGDGFASVPAELEEEPDDTGGP
jgi:hypothetical protein